MLLRLEDIDPTRCTQAHEQALLTDLAWLGVRWEPAIRRQSAHLADYAACLAKLDAMGVLYPCTCTRADIARAAAAPHHQGTGSATDPYGAPLYHGTCRGSHAARQAAAEGAPHCWRLNIQAAAARTGPLTFLDAGSGRRLCHPERFGDVVLARRDAPASYHLCVTHDDAIQSVTLVTRGEDLRDATDIHRLLQALLGWPTPLYAHHPLLTDATGLRLAKRDHAATLASLRESGTTPEQARASAMAGLGGFIQAAHMLYARP